MSKAGVASARRIFTFFGRHYSLQLLSNLLGMADTRPKISRKAAGASSLDALNSGVTNERQATVLDTTMRVTTPENISFEYQLAGPFRRILAYLLDFMVSICGFFAVALLIYLLVIFAIAPLAQGLGLTRVLEGLFSLVTGMMLVGFFIVYWFYGALMETYCNGQTFGKRWTQMRVLSADGHSIDGVQATLRNFFRLFDVSPVVPLASLGFDEEFAQIGVPTCLFGLIMMTFSQRFQRVGDLVANTVVVNEASVREPSLIVFTDDRVASLAELIPNNFVATLSLTKAVADYADQRRFLPPQRTHEIAAHVAQPLIEQMELLPDTDYDLFLCSLYYKIFVAAESPDGREKTIQTSTQESFAVTPGGQTRIIHEGF